MTSIMQNPFKENLLTGFIEKGRNTIPPSGTIRSKLSVHRLAQDELPEQLPENLRSVREGHLTHRGGDGEIR